MCSTIIRVLTSIFHNFNKFIFWYCHSCRTYTCHTDRCLIRCNNIKSFPGAITHICTFAAMKMYIYQSWNHIKPISLNYLSSSLWYIRYSCKFSIFNYNIRSDKAIILCKNICILYNHLFTPSICCTPAY